MTQNLNIGSLPWGVEKRPGEPVIWLAPSPRGTPRGPARFLGIPRNDNATIHATRNHPNRYDRYSAESRRRPMALRPRLPTI